MVDRNSCILGKSELFPSYRMILLPFFVVPVGVPAGETGPEQDSVRYCESSEGIDLRGNVRAHVSIGSSFLRGVGGTEYLGRDLLRE